MTTYNWNAAVSDLFSSAARWSPAGGPPGAGDDADISATGSNYTVTVNAGAAVNNLQTVANATLAIAGSQSFQMTAGTGSGANAGQITIANAAALTLGGTFDNTSTVSGGGLVDNAGANNTDIRLLGPLTTFTGGGTVALNGANARIYSVNGSSVETLVNVNNSFVGDGQIGVSQMTMINEAAGVVNGNVSGQIMTVDVNGGVTNSGLFEATGGGELFITGTGLDNTAASNAGKITATGAGSQVVFSGSSSIAGGTLSDSAGGAIVFAAGQTNYVDGSQAGSPVTITSGSAITQQNASTVDLYGVIQNNGVWTVTDTGNNTNLVANSAGGATDVQLTGTGSIVLATPNARLYGAQGFQNLLENVSETISGQGQLGAAQLTFQNDSGGVVNANSAAGPLTLNVNGNVANTGLLESTNTGGLLIQNTAIDNSGASNAGKISANGAGAVVNLEGSTIDGGTLSTTGAGAAINFLGSTTNTLNGSYALAPVIITAGSTLNEQNAAGIYLQGTIYNSGTINDNAGANNTDLRLNFPVVTLTTATPTSAGGLVELNGANARIYGNDDFQETLNNVNNTIAGDGQLGAGQMTMINGKVGKVDANVAGGTLVVDVNGGLTNNGLMEATVPVAATSSGILEISGTGVNQTGGGKIEAIGSKTVAAFVQLQNSTISGGSLISSNGPVSAPSAVIVLAGQSVTLDGTTKAVAISGNLDLQNSSTTYVQGSITDSKGAINFQSSGNNTDMRLNSTTVTFSGGGKVNFDATGNDRVFTNQNFQQLNNVDNTWSGSGNIGIGGNLLFYNETKGVIDATNATPLVLQASQGEWNNGVIEATGSGVLTVINGINNAVANSLGVFNTGVVKATGSGAVNLQGGGISGGAITTTGSGVVQVVAGNSGYLDGEVYIGNPQPITITAGSNVLVDNSATLYLYGTIDNAGTITIGTTGANNTDVRTNSSRVTLTGGGSFVFGGAAPTNDRLFNNQGGDVFDNVNNTISGGGQIGVGNQLSFTNGGTLDATNAAGFAINDGGFQVNNTGTMEATGGSISFAGGSLFNSGSLIVDAGQSISAPTLNVFGTGTATINGSGVLDIAESYSGLGGIKVSFASGATGTFRIRDAQFFEGTVAGLSAGGADQGTIDLANLGTTLDSLSWTQNGGQGTLTVSGSSGITASITLIGAYSQSNFTAVSDGFSGLDVQYNAVAAATINPGGSTHQTGGASSFAGQMASMGASSPASTTLAEQVRPALAMLATRA